MIMSSTSTMAASVALVGCVFACAMASPIGADEKDVASPRLKGWGQVTDPDHDCTITPGDGSLLFKVPGTPHDYSAEIGIQNAPLVLREIKGDFIAEVRVTGEFKPGDKSTIRDRRPYQGAGLIVIKDKNNYISLHRASLNVDGRVYHYANFGLRQGGEMTISQSKIQIPDRDAYLRLERRGNRVFNAISPDGVHWTSYDPIHLALPESIRFGFVGINSADVPLTFRFEDLTVFRKAEDE